MATQMKINMNEGKDDTHDLWGDFDDHGLGAISVQEAEWLVQWVHWRDAPPNFDDGDDMVGKDALLQSI